METLFDPTAYQSMLRRLDSIRPDAERQWGKMTVAQMMEHTARAVEVAAGKRVSKHFLIGKLLGWIYWKGFVGPKPFQRNGPTGADFIIRYEPAFDATKERLRTLVGEFHQLGEQGCDGNVHGFFGPMTGGQWGLTQHKHLDHHFRQFGA